MSATAVELGISEADWQEQVIHLATLGQWRHFHPYNMRRSDPGWPDLVLVRPPEILFVELKAQRGRLSQAQKEWIALLEACGLAVHVWRPSDIEAVVRCLTGPRKPLMNDRDHVPEHVESEHAGFSRQA